jgi:serine protease Do
MVATGAAGVLGAALFLNPWGLAKEQASAPPVHLKTSDEPVNRTSGEVTSFAPVVKQVTPSVVQVTVTTKARPMSRSNQQIPPFFRRFFGEEPQGFGQFQNPMIPPKRGEGSGVIVTEDGYILTNNHVVDGADNIEVTLNDGKEYRGKVIGRDEKTDIAVIKIDAKELPAITLADSDKIEVGDVVLAVGNPFGIGQTVTSGIVSAKGRATLGLDYEDFIQTDAAINPGNSGGALVDAEGRLIGINTAILSRTGGNQGIGFAVPTNLARWVMQELVDDGQVERGFLGVNIQDLTPELAKHFGIDEPRGALVAEVTPGSPAAKAGIKSGDVIRKFNGKEVRDSRNLKLAVGATAPGSKVPVEIAREGDSMTLQVRLSRLGGDLLAANPDSSPDGINEALRGVGVADLDRSNRAALDVPEDVKGAVVTEVAQDSAAYEAGLRPGDVIVEINREPVDNAEAAVEACTNPEDPVTLVKVWSRGISRFLVVDESRAG